MANRRKPKYDRRQKRDVFQQLIDTKRTDIFIPARMGDKDKVVKGSKRGYVYCRLPNGQVIQVRNSKVAARPGRNVLLGYEPTRPGLLQVLAPRDSIVDDDMYDIPSHGDSHTWPEYDAAYVRDEQYLPLLAVPSGDWEVQIYRKVLLWPDQSAYVLIADQKVDLTAHKITSGAKWVLLQADNTGVVTGKDGSLVDSRQLLTESNIPMPDADHIAPHAVKFYAGQKKLQKSKRVNDFLDLRFGAYGSGGGGGIPTTTAANDVQVGDGSGSWIKKTLAEFVTILRTALDSVYAASAKGVTNGDSHDHNGGDGAQIAYSTLSGLPTLGSAAALNVGTTAGTVAAGDDSRLSNARAPTAHAASHKSGSADAIKLDELDAPTDVTTLNASTSAHGLAPKATAPALGLINVLGIANGETVWSAKALLDSINPAAIGAASAGSATVAARRDHVHSAAESAITFTDITTNNASTTAHGYAPKATAPASGLVNVLGIANGETVYSNKALFDTTAPAALGTASAGSATVAARRDHVHDKQTILLPFGVYAGVGPFSADAVPYAASGGYTMTLVNLVCGFYVATTNNGSNYWSIAIESKPSNTTIKTLTTASASPNVFTSVSSALSGTVASSDILIRVVLTKVGSPGNIYFASPNLEVKI